MVEIVGLYNIEKRNISLKQLTSLKFQKASVRAPRLAARGGSMR